MKNVIYSLLALVIGVMVTVVPLQAQQQKDTARWPLQLFWLVDTEGVFQHKPPADALFQPLKSAAPKTLERTVWFRLEANNPSPCDSTFLFSCANQDFVDVFQKSDTGLVLIGKTGKFYPKSKRDDGSLYRIRVIIPCLKTATFYIKILNYGLSCDPPAPEILRWAGTQAFEDQSRIGRSSSLWFLYLFLGGFCMMSAISMIYFIFTRKRAYFWYAAYTGLMVLHIAINEEVMDLSSWPFFGSSPFGYRYFSGLLVLGFMAFVQFTRRFCNLNRSFLMANKLSKALFFILLFIVVFHLYCFFSVDSPVWTKDSSNLASYSSLLVGLWGAMALWRTRGQSTRLLFLGMLCFLILSGVVYWISRIMLYHLNMDMAFAPNQYYGFGLLLQVLFFSAALAQKSREEEVFNQQLSAQLVEAKEAILKERTRIASDLHDHLGVGLSAVQFLSAQLSSEENDPKRREKLHTIRRLSNQAVQGIRDILWALSDDKTNEKSLFSHLRSEATNFLTHFELPLHYEAPQSIERLNFGSTHCWNLLQVTREALNNIVRHANATRVWISIRLEGATLRIDIRDNGNGRAETARAGNGYRTMRKRMAELGGSCAWENSPEGGLVVTLIIPVESSQKP